MGIAGAVVTNKLNINIKDAYDDGRWQGRELDKKMNYRTRSILCGKNRLKLLFIIII